METNLNAETELITVSAFFLSFRINEEYTMLMHQTQPEGNMLVNQAVMEIFAFFQSPHAINDLTDTEEQETAQFLVEHGFLVASGTVETGEAQTEPDELVIWLHLTDCCNFRCTYCYLPHLPQEMSMETAKACIRKAFEVAHQQDYHQLQIKYSGGEPLLRFSMVMELHAFASELATEQKISLPEIVLSNGSLLNETIIHNLINNDIALMVSFDQLEDGPHNQRLLLDGSHTSSLVRNKIELALQYGLKPQISITVSKQNIETLPVLVEWLLHHNLLFSLNFYRENTCSPRDSELSFTDQDMIAGLMKTYQIIEKNLPEWNLLASLADRANLLIPHSKPCGVGENYLVFTTNGEIASCHMDIDHPQTTLSDPTPFSTILANPEGFKNVSIEKRPNCQNCPWRNWCAGGCPYLTHHVTGKSTNRSPNCEIYQAIFPEIIRLEGLRLIREIERSQ